MRDKFLRSTALFLLAVMVMGLMPVYGTDNPPGVTVRIHGLGEELIPPTRVSYEEFDLTEYGFEPVGEGVTALHALIAALVANGFDPSNPEVLSLSYGFVDTLLNFEGGAPAYWMYVVNNESVILGLPEQPLSPSDTIVLYYVEDYSYAFFDRWEIEEKENREFTLTLYSQYYDWVEDDNVTVVNPGCGIYINGVDSGEVTDDNGRISLSFAEAGEYVITAQGTCAYSKIIIGEADVTGVMIKPAKQSAALSPIEHQLEFEDGTAEYTVNMNYYCDVVSISPLGGNGAVRPRREENAATANGYPLTVGDENIFDIGDYTLTIVRLPEMGLVGVSADIGDISFLPGRADISVVVPEELQDVEMTFMASEDSTVFVNDVEMTGGNTIIFNKSDFTEHSILVRKGDVSARYILNIITLKQQIIEEQIQAVLDTVSRDYTGTHDMWQAFDMAAYGLPHLVNQTKIAEDAIGIINKNSNVTDLEKAIITLSAIGYDAEELNGIATLTQRESITDFSQLIFGLIALDSGAYELSDDAKTTRDSLIEGIFSWRKSDGGFGYLDSYDLDMTAMAVPALAPYHEREDIQAVLDDCREYIKKSSYNNSNTISVAIIALASIGEECDALVESLMEYKTESNHFGLLDNKTVNNMSTEQGFRALIAYRKFKETGTAVNLYQFERGANRNDTIVTKALETKVTEAEGLDSGIYTESSYGRLLEAIAAAKEIYAKSDATQEQIDECLLAISNAIELLVKAPNNQGGTGSDNTKTVTITITGDSSMGTILNNVRITVSKSDTVFDILKMVLDERGIDFAIDGKGTSSYISGIDGLYEFSDGPNSGWIYRVNGKLMEVGVGAVTPVSGDKIQVVYTLDWTMEKDAKGITTGSSSGKQTEKNEEKPQNEEKIEDVTISETVFTDISGWSEEYILFLYDKGIIKGKTPTLFVPRDNMTRAELISILMRISNTEYDNSIEDGFYDLHPDDWYYNAMLWAKSHGIAIGYNGYAYPNSPVLRQDAAVLIHRFVLKFPEFSLDEKTKDAQFSDWELVALYAREAVLALAQSDIIIGNENNLFLPLNHITREEVAKIITTLYKEGGTL